ncbi:hypothetical protein [Thalassobellus citreus]|uniref:hypothetical protein n=1 Tax=Thalassobellus citreus TaxID=3367752 RepID=UPI0037A53C8D
MAFTVRKLSEKSQKKVLEIIENNPKINTKSSAINYALERHEFYKKYEYDLQVKNKQILALKKELFEIKKALQFLKSL